MSCNLRLELENLFRNQEKMSLKVLRKKAEQKKLNINLGLRIEIRKKLLSIELRRLLKKD